MIELRKEEIEKALKEGKVIFLEGSNVSEKRLYRLNTELNIIEYSDDNKTWNKSNMKLDDLNNNDWVIFE